MRTRPTELANRTRYAFWRRRIDRPLVGGQKAAVARLHTIAGEVSLRSRWGKYAQNLSKLVDSGQTVVSGINPLKHATSGEVSRKIANTSRLAAEYASMRGGTTTASGHSSRACRPFIAVRTPRAFAS